LFDSLFFSYPLKDKRSLKIFRDKAIGYISMVQKTKRRKLNNIKYAGVHLIAEFWKGRNIEDKKELKEILLNTAKEANNIPLEVAIHKFSPYGITGVVLLAESHIALHFWPEFNYLAVDIFTCGDASLPEKGLEYLKKELKPQKVEVKKIKRGKIYL